MEEEASKYGWLKKEQHNCKFTCCTASGLTNVFNRGLKCRQVLVPLLNIDGIWIT